MEPTYIGKTIVVKPGKTGSSDSKTTTATQGTDDYMSNLSEEEQRIALERAVADVKLIGIRSRFAIYYSQNTEQRLAFIANVNEEIKDFSVTELGVYRDFIYSRIAEGDMSEEEIQAIFDGLNAAWELKGQTEELPNWYDSEVWLNNDSASYNSGQCTYYTAGIAREAYGFYLGIENMGRDSAYNICQKYPDMFDLRSSADGAVDINDIVPGTIISYGRGTNGSHVAIVLSVDYENGTVISFNGNVTRGSGDDSYETILSYYESGAPDWRYDTMAFNGGNIGGLGSTWDLAIPKGGYAEVGYAYYQQYGANPTAGREDENRN